MLSPTDDLLELSEQVRDDALTRVILLLDKLLHAPGGKEQALPASYVWQDVVQAKEPSTLDNRIRFWKAMRLRRDWSRDSVNSVLRAAYVNFQLAADDATHPPQQFASSHPIAPQQAEAVRAVGPSTQEELAKWLDETICNRELRDLHTHLLGMGSWTFWLRIIKERVPEWVKRRAIEWYLLPVGGVLDHSSILDTEPTSSFMERPDDPTRSFCDRLRGMPHLRQFCEKALGVSVFDCHENNLVFTYDVVYDVTTWCKALDQSKVHTAADVADVLGISEVELTRRQYVVWNARKQQLEKRQGLTNSRLVELLSSRQSTRLEQALKNCFSMLQLGGEPADDSTIVRLFEGEFDPLFFPMRYALKDSLYEQYLDVLDELLTHVTRDLYEPNGVSYVEFSVGFSDMVDNLAVFRHLYKFATSTRAQPVEVRYLIGFQRSNSPALSAELKELREKKKTEQQLLDQCFAPTSYNISLTMLGRLQSSMVRSQRAADKLMQVAVGLDYMANEQDHPYCPFGLREFTNFVKKCRIEHNARFGMRYHCGELHVDLRHEPLLWHMAISSLIVSRILADIPSGPVPLRIGHGVGFLPFIPLQEVAGMDQNILFNAVFQAIKIMGARSVPVEVNLRSNELLVKRALKNASLVSSLDNVGMSLVLCTDNDGIWDMSAMLRGRTYGSVASEFARAITANVVFDVFSAQKMVGQAVQASFDDVKQRSRASAALYRLESVETTVSFGSGSSDRIDQIELAVKAGWTLGKFQSHNSPLEQERAWTDLFALLKAAHINVPEKYPSYSDLIPILVSKCPPDICLPIFFSFYCSSIQELNPFGTRYDLDRKDAQETLRRALRNDKLVNQLLAVNCNDSTEVLSFLRDQRK